MHQNTLLLEGLKPTQAWERQNGNNELLVVGFNFNNITLVDSGGDRKDALRYSYCGGVVPPLFIKAQGTGVKAITGVFSSLRHVHYNLLSNFLYCWSLFLEGLTNDLDLVTSFGSWIGLVTPLRAEFAWYPGIRAIYIHILEDKDVFKRVGDSILVMVMIRSIRDGQLKIRMIRIEEGYSSMMTWRNGTTCTLTNFFFPGNHVPDKQNEVAKLFNRLIGLSPINRGSGISHQLFDEMAGSFPVKLEVCVGPNKELRLSDAAFFKYLGCEGLASVVSSTKLLSELKFELNIKFRSGVVSMCVFYPRTSANDGQWNGYKGHVNVQCIGAVPFGIIDHLVVCRSFDPGGFHFPQIDSDPFEFIVPTKVLDVQILYAFFLCQNHSIVMDVIGHLRSSYDDAKDGYLQHMEQYSEKGLGFLVLCQDVFEGYGFCRCFYVKDF